MERKTDFESLLIETFLFLYRLDLCLSCPTTLLPRLRVEGHRHQRQQTRANPHVSNVSNVSGLLSEVRIDQSDPNILVLHVNINERKHAVDAMLLCLHFRLSLQIFTKSKFISYIKVEQKQTGLS